MFLLFQTYSPKMRRCRILNYAVTKQGGNDVGIFNGNATLTELQDKKKMCVQPCEEKSSGRECMCGDGLPGTVNAGSTSCGHQPGTSCQPGISAHFPLPPTSPLNCRTWRRRPGFHKNTAHSLFCGKFVIFFFLHAVRWCTSSVTLSRVGSAYSAYGSTENRHTHTAKSVLRWKRFQQPCQKHGCGAAHLHRCSRSGLDLSLSP